MLVQSIDNKLYRNPTFQGHRWVLRINDDGVVLERQGRVTWKTAHRGLAKSGIRCKLDSPLQDGTAVIGEALVQVSRFKVILKKPVPVPENHQGMISGIECDDLDGERILWIQKSKSKK